MSVERNAVKDSVAENNAKTESCLNILMCRKVREGASFAALVIIIAVLFSEAKWYAFLGVAIVLYLGLLVICLGFACDGCRKVYAFDLWKWIEPKIPRAWLMNTYGKLTVLIWCTSLLALKVGGFIGLVLASASAVLCAGLIGCVKNKYFFLLAATLMVAGAVFILRFTSFLCGSSIDCYSEQAYDKFVEIVNPDAAREHRIEKSVEVWKAAFGF